jgi:hypothetical protein
MADTIKEYIARSATYSCLMATDVSNRREVMEAYEENGWKILDTRRNRRTQNEINLLIKEL